MKKRILALLPVLALVGANLGCDGKTTAQGDSTADKSGRLTGFVRDAKSGDSVNFFNPEGKTTNDKDDNSGVNQIWVLVDGNIVSAKPCGTEDKDLSLQAGCYTVGDLPTGAKLPIFVTHSSYERFASSFTIDPTVTTAAFPGSSGTGPVFADKPQAYGNIKLFPKGVNYDQVVETTFDGSGDVVGVADVSVRCVLCSGNSLDVLGAASPSNLLSPETDANPIVSGTTDSNGKVTFAGSSLTKGGKYGCGAHATNPLNGDVISKTPSCAGSGTFIAGISDPTVTLALTSEAADGLVALFSNIDDPEEAIGASGPVTIVLNRAASVYTGTTDCQDGSVTAGTVADGTAPALTTDANDDDAESVTVSIDTAGTTVTVTPNFSTAISNDRFVNFAFGGIYLVPSSGLTQDVISRVGTPVDTAGFSLTTFTTPATCTLFNGLGNVSDLANVRTGAAQGTTGRLVN